MAKLGYTFTSDTLSKMVFVSLYYWAREFSTTLTKGKEYTELPRTVVISIVAFSLFPCEEYNSEFQPLEADRQASVALF